MALCDSHSGSHWLSLPLSGIFWPSLAHYCSLILLKHGPWSALRALAWLSAHWHTLSQSANKSSYILLCEVQSFNITCWIFLSFIHIVCNILLYFFCKISLLFAIFYLYFVFVLASIKFKALTISSEGEKVLENFWGKNLIRWGWRWWGRRRGQKYNFEIQFFVLELSDWIRNITL